MYYLANIPVNVYHVQLSLLYYLIMCFSAIGMLTNQCMNVVLIHWNILLISVNKFASLIYRPSIFKWM